MEAQRLYWRDVQKQGSRGDREAREEREKDNAETQSSQRSAEKNGERGYPHPACKKAQKRAQECEKKELE